MARLCYAKIIMSARSACHPHVLNILELAKWRNIARVFAWWTRCPGIARLIVNAFKQCRPAATGQRERERERERETSNAGVIKLFRNVSSMGVPDQP